VEFSFAEVHEAVAAAVPDREAIVAGPRRLTFGGLAERSCRLANLLSGRGLGAQRERDGLAGWESGQDALALYLYNGNEYLEGMLGAFKSRLAPFNVNYRYVEEELAYLLRNARARALVYHAEFAPTLARVLPDLPDVALLLQVADDSGHALLPGALDYEEALAGASPARPELPWSPDDLYILYTGGTTGMPKGVLWRSADVFVAAMGGRKLDGSEFTSLEEVVANAKNGGTMRVLVGPPLMHGAAQWVSFIYLSAGHTLLFQDDPRRFDAHDVLSSMERERATALTIVGDAFAVPILDQLARREYELSSLVMIGSGGAPLSVAHKEALLARLPHVTVLDAIGSSETGAQATNPASRAMGVSTGTFRPGPGACVVSEDLSRVLRPGDDELGWFAQTGRVPLGYLGDPEKTRRTFPVIGGLRHSVPGDRARWRADGQIEVLGRDSVTINSGGEKIFAEEVENALKLHPDVWDAVVCGRPSERWGQEVVAIVQLREGVASGEADLLAECARHLARYKLPKAFVFCERIVRSPSGKADYRWARQRALEAAS
jgi:fatty-acyl-CoA synthase